MKKIRNIIIVLSLFFMVSCNWLEIKPRTESTKKDLFKTESGFQDALIGIYIQMINDATYGSALTFGTIDEMAGIYDNTGSTSLGYKLKMHDWTDAAVESSIKSMFSGLYKIISSSNSLLSEIDNQKGVFSSEKNYRIIKGEALAIRAMCHLDLLRLFGPIPSEPTAAKILPYVKTFGKELTEHSTWSEYCNLLMTDLSDAEMLLSEDPILHYSVQDLNNPNGYNSEYKNQSAFLASRSSRFNYYAVKAIQARANFWIGNKEAALAAAKVVIDAKNTNGTKKFTLGTSSDFSNNDYIFSNEHILAIYDFKLYQKYTTKFKGATYYKGSSSSGFTTAITKQLYGTTKLDIREPEVGKWWMTTTIGSSTYGICNKYYTPEVALSDENNSGVTPGINSRNRIPLFRLSEMYLIVAETAPITEAKVYYDTFLRSRNLQPVVLTEANRALDLMKECRKEFYSEGHIFYSYKRNNTLRKDILWSLSSLVPNYVLPKPSDELIYKE